jgi:hypothetical protein
MVAVDLIGSNLEAAAARPISSAPFLSIAAVGVNQPPVQGAAAFRLDPGDPGSLWLPCTIVEGTVLMCGEGLPAAAVAGLQSGLFSIRGLESSLALVNRPARCRDDPKACPTAWLET